VKKTSPRMSQQQYEDREKGDATAISVESSKTVEQSTLLFFRSDPVQGW